MKYPQLVSTRAVNAISDWLESRLEKLGVDAPLIYSRLLLSLLHTPLQLHAIDIAELAQQPPHHQHHHHHQLVPAQSLGTRPLRNHRPDDHHFAAAVPRHQSESLKRQAAIESLTNVVADNQTDQIECLVDELCAKLREIEAQSGAEPSLFDSSATDDDDGSLNGGTVPIEDPAKRYYRAFPALSKDWSTEHIVQMKPNAESWPPANFRHQHFDETNNNDAVAENMNNSAGSQHSVDTLATATVKRTRPKRHRRYGRGKSNASFGTPGLSSGAGSGGIGRKAVWDTNIEGHWEMGRDLIREFVMTQKMGLERHELVDPSRKYGDGAKMQNLRARYERSEQEQAVVHVSDDVRDAPTPRRLYERDVSSESLNLITPTAVSQDEEEAIHLAMYEAKFDHNMAALWSDTPDHHPVAPLPPAQNVSSFWSNYNRHRYTEEPATVQSPSDALSGHSSAHYELGSDLPVQHESMLRLNFTDQHSPVVQAQHLAVIPTAGQSKNHTGEDDVSFYSGSWNNATNIMPDGEAAMKERKMREAFNAGFDPHGALENVRPFGNQLSFWSNSASLGTPSRPHESDDSQQTVMNHDAIAVSTTAAAAAAWSTDIDSTAGWPSTNYGPYTWSTQGTDTVTSIASTTDMLGSHENRLRVATLLKANHAQSRLFAPMNPHEAVNKYFSQPPIGTAHMNWAHGPLVHTDEADNASASSSSSSSFTTLHNHSQNSGFIKVASSSSISSGDKPIATATSTASNSSSYLTNNNVIWNDDTVVKPQVPRLVRTPIVSCDESLMPQRSIDAALGASAPAAAAAPAESIPELEHTHFRPIKFTYFDGHTFDIPSKLNEVDYRRSPGGSTWVDQDKYMRWIPCEDSDDETTASEAGGDRSAYAGMSDGGEREDFVIKFCVKQQNEKGCQTADDDLDEVDHSAVSIRFGTVGAFSQGADGGVVVRPVSDASVFAVSTAVGGEVGEFQNDMDEWYRRSAAAECCVQGNAAHTLWEHCDVCGMRPDVASMPADRAWLAELSADGDEIMSDLRYMQRLYIGNDCDGEEEDDEELNNEYGARDRAHDDIHDHLQNVEVGTELVDNVAAFGLAETVSNEPPNDIFYNVNKFISDLLRPERARDLAEQAAQRRNPFDEGIGRQMVNRCSETSPLAIPSGVADRYVGGLWNHADNFVWRRDASPDGGHTDSVSSVWSSASTAPMAAAAESTCGSVPATWEHSNLVQIWNDDAIAAKSSPVATLSVASAGTSMSTSISGSSSCADDLTDPVSSETSKRCDRKRRHSASQNLLEMDDTVAGRVRSYAARKHSSMYGDEPDLTTIITFNYWTTAATAGHAFLDSAQALREETGHTIDEMGAPSTSVILRNMAIRSARPLTR